MLRDFYCSRHTKHFAEHNNNFLLVCSFIAFYHEAQKLSHILFTDFLLLWSRAVITTLKKFAVQCNNVKSFNYS